MAYDTYMENRRQYPRHDLDWPILLRQDSGTRRIGELINISLSGLLMTLNEPVPPEAAGNFELFVCRPRHSAEMLEIHGQTVWMEAGTEDFTWALELVDLQPGDRQTLADFIAEPEQLAIELELSSS